jgi:hypothetical protein
LARIKNFWSCLKYGENFTRRIKSPPTAETVIGAEDYKAFEEAMADYDAQSAASLWRQTGQILYALEVLDRRKPQGTASGE